MYCVPNVHYTQMFDMHVLLIRDYLIIIISEFTQQYGRKKRTEKCLSKASMTGLLLAWKSLKKIRASFQLLKLENSLRWSFFTFIYNCSSNMNYFINFTSVRIGLLKERLCGRLVTNVLQEDILILTACLASSRAAFKQS